MRRGVLLVATLSTLTGFLIVLLAADALPLTDPLRNGPRWVIILSGLAFLLAGVLTVLVELQRYEAATGAVSLVGILRTLIGLLLVLIFLTLGNWVAFGPGDRDIQATLSTPLFGAASGSSSFLGRAAFGIGAVILDLFLLYGLVMSVWRRAREKTSANQL
jgi:hypothetical protein